MALDRPLRVFYDLDTPVTLDKLRGGDLDYLRAEQIAEFDLVLSWSRGRSLVELETVWKAALARPLFGCVDPDIYVAGAPRDVRFECALSYMGTYAADRQDKLDRLFLECATASAGHGISAGRNALPVALALAGERQAFRSRLTCRASRAVFLVEADVEPDARRDGGVRLLPVGQIFRSGSLRHPDRERLVRGTRHFLPSGRRDSDRFQYRGRASGSRLG